jgi:hypothetical protein
MNKQKTLLVLLMVLFFINGISATEINDFDIVIDVRSPNSATITEKWKVSVENENDLISFKESILAANVDLIKLEAINKNLKPHIYINKFSKLSVEFDEIDLVVKLEYSTEDVILIKYLDYEDQIIWEFNENLLSNFVESGLYHIPKNSRIKVFINHPLIIGDVLPKGTLENNSINWTGISTNEIRLLAIEKKIPLATFNVSDFFNKVYLKGVFYYTMIAIIFIILVLLLFKKKVSKGIKSFVRKHSIIKQKKQINDVIDIDLVNKKE